MKTLYLLLMLILPVSNNNVLEDDVDLVEYNHYHDSNMEHVFDQFIFYDWSNQKKRFQVRAWKLVKCDSQIPRRNGDQWLVRWHDDGVLREVNAKFRRETWTQYDPELVERNHLPQDQRLDLKAPIVNECTLP